MAVVSVGVSVGVSTVDIPDAVSFDVSLGLPVPCSVGLTCF